MPLPTKKLIDYTQRGKPLSQEYCNQFEHSSSSPMSACSSSSAAHSSAATSAISSRQRECTNNDDCLASIVSLLRSEEADITENEEPIDFMFKIPSGVDRRREQRSDLRQRFSQSRTHKLSSSSIIESTLTKNTSITTTKEARALQRASF
jgi:hypothetical protein